MQKQNVAKILCVGAGPASCLFSIAYKLLVPSADITIVEKNERHVKTGWGVIIPDELITLVESVDIDLCNQLKAMLKKWTGINVVRNGETVKIPKFLGHSVDRYELTQSLISRAESLGVTFSFSVFFDEYKAAELDSYDLVVWGDGASSAGRRTLLNEESTSIIWSDNHFIWLGTNMHLSSMEFYFERVDSGVICAHMYPYSDDMCTFVVECSDRVFQVELSELSESERLAKLETIFSKSIPGLHLIPLKNTRQWRRFPQIYTDRPFVDCNILIGDAAHTAHFSIGSGTKLAVDDAIFLARSLSQESSVALALDTYSNIRQEEVRRLQSAALNSMRWFDEVDNMIDMETDVFIDGFMRRGFIHRSTQIPSASDATRKTPSRRVVLEAASGQEAS